MHAAALFGALGALNACGSDGGTGADLSGQAECRADGPSKLCSGQTYLQCGPGGQEQSRTDCGAQGLVCTPNLGCTVCVPGATQCDGSEQVLRCKADGSGYEPSHTCDTVQGNSCSDAIGDCAGPCADAERANTSTGCEFFPVTTMNSQTRFEFGVALENPSASDTAQVVISREGQEDIVTEVAPQSIETVVLPWVNALKARSGARLVEDGAYHLRSNRPLNAYQFNSLENVSNLSERTRTNDATLLLPKHALTGNYIALTQPHWQIGGVTSVDHPSTLSIVGTEAFPVEVSVTFSSPVEVNIDGSNERFEAGATERFTLELGDVLQLATPREGNCSNRLNSISVSGIGTVYTCDTRHLDLTGTEVHANGKVAVITGNDRAAVPVTAWSGDHLEHALYPLETWGKQFVVHATASEGNLYRLVSGADGNTIRFSEAVTINGQSVTETRLDRGQALSFEHAGSLVLESDAAILVAQMMFSAMRTSIATTNLAVANYPQRDSAMALVPPMEQNNTTHRVLSPAQYKNHFLNIVVPVGASVQLNGATLDPSLFAPVGNGAYQVLRQSVDAGAHLLQSSAPMGVTVYGTSYGTSYMYVGSGLKFSHINELI
ncbi:MAG: IgGFc-binding protein [Polyangiales bacterium]